MAKLKVGDRVRFYGLGLGSGLTPVACMDPCEVISMDGTGSLSVKVRNTLSSRTYYVAPKQCRKLVKPSARIGKAATKTRKVWLCPSDLENLAHGPYKHYAVVATLDAKDGWPCVEVVA